jgi:hypothetical protein
MALLHGGVLAAGGASDPVAAVVSDYQAVRKVALALAVIGFLLGVTWLGNSEMPGERHRAQSLVTMTAVIFILLVGDRMIAQGVAGWFGIPTASLPVFWQ